ncbi:hypothetical protein BLNAU_10816 [Blattamonas nauphoetae]|uniref:Uncharacterized protein n=1 Tax=Blattamonas nauphoetae TaxID=2049346 RepID=A0ABQ9XSM2_9EUKA|nr:hypothetical protein BLNAU_10816 [Blattamonas nauphoetae]
MCLYSKYMPNLCTKCFSICRFGGEFNGRRIAPNRQPQKLELIAQKLRGENVSISPRKSPLAERHVHNPLESS